MRIFRPMVTYFQKRSPAPNPEQLYWASELRDILIKCLEELSPIFRMVFGLRDIEGLTIDQTVEVLDVSETAVKARLWRARLQLRESLNEYFSEQAESARAESSSCKTLTDRHQRDSMATAQVFGKICQSRLQKLLPT